MGKQVCDTRSGVCGVLVDVIGSTAYARMPSALEWRAKDPGSRWVKLFYDDDDLVAVMLYEYFVDDEEGNFGYFIAITAVAKDRQGQGLGTAIMADVLNLLADRCPRGGVLQWKVRPNNFASLRMCEKLGFTEEWWSNWKGFIRFTTPVDDYPVPLRLA